jgi:medium-chain acyl-[acyl-carrier-protein] hydrolase
MLPTLRADLALCETYEYRPEEPFDFPIAVFGGTEDNTASESEHAAWRTQTRQSFTLRMFDGDHFFLHSAKLPLLMTLGQDLQRAARPSWLSDGDSRSLR